MKFVFKALSFSCYYFPAIVTFQFHLSVSGVVRLHYAMRLFVPFKSNVGSKVDCTVGKIP